MKNLNLLDLLTSKHACPHCLEDIPGHLTLIEALSLIPESQEEQACDKGLVLASLARIESLLRELIDVMAARGGADEADETNCTMCGALIEDARRSTRLYCSAKCNKRAQRQRAKTNPEAFDE